VRFGIENARALFVNDYELGMIGRLTSMKPVDILKYVQFLVVTRGEEGSTIYTSQGEIHIPIVPAAQIVDPTGVGDAFRGGFLTGYGHGWDLELCGQMGALAATYCLEQPGPQGHSYTPAEFVARFRQSFDDHGKLDVLCGKE
jgi:adenosine kinase